MDEKFILVICQNQFSKSIEIYLVPHKIIEQKDHEMMRDISSGFVNDLQKKSFLSNKFDSMFGIWKEHIIKYALYDFMDHNLCKDQSISTIYYFA
jgi:hypothetical protein